MKIVELKLPEWAWVDGGEHEPSGDPLKGREVIIHIRSASVMEVFNHGEVVSKMATLQYDFDCTNAFGVIEHKTMLLHFSPQLHISDDNDRETLLEIMQKGAKWYCSYCDWEDANIKDNDITYLN